MLGCIREILGRGPWREDQGFLERKELLPGGDTSAGCDPKNTSPAWTRSRPGSAMPEPSATWVAAMIGLDDGWLNLKKGAIAAIGFPGPPEFSRGELQWLVTANSLSVKWQFMNSIYQSLP